MSGGDIGNCETPAYKIQMLIDGLKEELENHASPLNSVEPTVTKRIHNLMTELNFAYFTIKAIEEFVNGDTSVAELKVRLRHYRE
jgi:hypothetical protein